MQVFSWILCAQVQWDTFPSGVRASTSALWGWREGHKRSVHHTLQFPYFHFPKKSKMEMNTLRGLVSSCICFCQDCTSSSPKSHIPICDWAGQRVLKTGREQGLKRRRRRDQEKGSVDWRAGWNVLLPVNTHAEFCISWLVIYSSYPAAVLDSHNCAVV